MSFPDWIFHSRVTEATIPSNIEIATENSDPLLGLTSLRIQDLGAPALATVVLFADPLFFDTKIELGRIRTTFRKNAGLGFQDHGVFFLSSGNNPLHNEVSTYAAHYSSGGTTVRVTRFTNGLHDTEGTLLHSYTVPFSGSDEAIVIEMIVEAGLLTRLNGYTKITVRFGSSTTNFGNLLTLSPSITDSLNPLFTGTCGMFVRSRGITEPLNARIGATEIWRSNSG